MTSLVSPHWTPCWAAALPAGAHAGGFGLVALTGFVFDAACASGSGSSGPFGLPGKLGWACRNVAGTPSIVIDWTVMSEPGTAAVLEMLLLRSKSRLNSLRHCVDFCISSTCVPGRNLFVTAS